MDLALQNSSSPIQAKAIARRHGIPARFLEQILNSLKKAGLVESLRGAQGGYLLRKAPADITLAHIVEALDGPLGSGTPHKPASRRLRERAKLDALLSEVWERVRQAELGVLSAVTLQDIADRHRHLEQGSALMYHI